MQNRKINKVRISEKEYNDLIKKGELVKKETDNPNSRNYKRQFFQQNQYPTLTELGEHHVIYRLKEFLPYLVFYYEVYEPEDDGFDETYKLLDDIFNKLVIKVKDEDAQKIEDINPTYYKKMDLDERAESLLPLIKYYDSDDFDLFLDDLEWKNFMLAYGYRKNDYKKEKRNLKMEDDLRKVWNIAKGEF